jgi:hypothetical protein
MIEINATMSFAEFRFDDVVAKGGVVHFGRGRTSHQQKQGRWTPKDRQMVQELQCLFPYCR